MLIPGNLQKGLSEIGSWKGRLKKNIDFVRKIDIIKYLRRRVY